MGVGLVVLVGAPWSGAGKVVIVGGGPIEKAGREAYALLKCIYFSAMFTLTGDFYPCVIFSWIPTLSFRFLRVVA